MMLGKIIPSFIHPLYRYKIHVFIGIDATGFKITQASEY
jgi:hypothetical protein